MERASDKAKIGYLLMTYPKISETFVLNEILALEAKGAGLTILSLRTPADPEVLPAVAKVRSPLWYVPESLWERKAAALRAHLALISLSPNRYGLALWFSFRRKEGWSLRSFVQAGAVAWRLRRAGVVRLHAHFADTPTDVAELVHLLTGIPFSFTAHAKDIYCSDPEVLDRKIHRAEFVVTCTEYNRQFLQKVSTNGTPIHRIYHGIDTQQFHARAVDRRSQAEALPTLLSVGCFREKKGFTTLLRACRILKQQGRRFRCWIVGDGPLRPVLEALIRVLDLQDSVSLLGKKTQDEVIGLYREATVFLLPCEVADNGDRDGIPNVLMEAMAMGLPVVSTDVSGIPELIRHDRNGCLVPQRDPEALATMLGRLLDDPGLRDAFSRAGQETVAQKFSTFHMSRQLTTLFLAGDRSSPANDPFHEPSYSQATCASARM